MVIDIACFINGFTAYITYRREIKILLCKNLIKFRGEEVYVLLSPGVYL